jgi:hypothetical protein
MNPGGGGRPNNLAGHGQPGNNRALPQGHREVPTRDGGRMRTNEHGQIREVHTARGQDIYRGPHGERRVINERADHSRVFAEGRNRGYYQGHPYNYHGREFARRTYYEHGVAYDRFYNRYPYHGVVLEAYSPRVYYAPGFYGYAYAPFAAPVPYAWGWGGSPWVGYYGAYFTPYPVYSSPALWLTDYMISTSLAASYQQQLEAGAGGAPPPPQGPPAALTPEVKQMIADEVQRQIARENTERGQMAQTTPDAGPVGVARSLSDNTPHVFVAGSDLFVTDAAGQECALSQGDVVQLVGPPSDPNASAASLTVLASKGQDCRKGNTVSVELTDLQSMQNHMRETIDQGLGDIQSKAGQTGGLPALPAAAKAATVPAPFVADAPPPDPNALAQINQQVQEADTAEKEATAQGPSDSAGASPAPPSINAGPPPEIKLGMTIAQVVAINGQPTKTADGAGGKKIYFYKDMKIIFTDGKVSDNQ